MHLLGDALLVRQQLLTNLTDSALTFDFSFSLNRGKTSIVATNKSDDSLHALVQIMHQLEKINTTPCTPLGHRSSL